MILPSLRKWSVRRAGSLKSSAPSPCPQNGDDQRIRGIDAAQDRFHTAA